MTPEGEVLKAICEYLKELKKQGDPLWFFKVHGGRHQEAGVPDLSLCWYGRSLWIEAKRPVGGKVSPLQAHQMKKIRAAGGKTLVATSVDEVREFLEGERP